jgi:hypothetical protein
VWGQEIHTRQVAIGALDDLMDEVGRVLQEYPDLDKRLSVAYAKAKRTRDASNTRVDL